MPLPSLKPCPFCGSDRIRASSSYRPINETTAEIRCSGCGIAIKANSFWDVDHLDEGELLEKLSAMWNRRAGDGGGTNASA